MFHFRVWELFVLFWPPKVHLWCSSPICSSVLELIAVLFAQIFVPVLSFLQGIILSASDNTDVLFSRHLFFSCRFFKGHFRYSQATLLSVLSFYIKRASTLGTCVSILAPFFPLFIQEQVCSSDGSLRLLISFRPLYHVIQSQAALACASCARSLGSGNRCPGVFWSGVHVLLLPSSALCPLWPGS